MKGFLMKLLPTRKALVGALAAVPLVLGLALVPATSAAAANGQLSITNNCGRSLTYYVRSISGTGNGGGNGYITAGTTQRWSPSAGSWVVSSSAGSRTYYVAANRGLAVKLC
jgi:hypothetical protein